tara:strand:- start:515 stop:625 length:111 start_codon:yes stop_codon:yes gene_type:complete
MLDETLVNKQIRNKKIKNLFFLKNLVEKETIKIRKS